MPLPRVLEPEVMSSAEEAGEYENMDFSATDVLFAERAAQLVRGASAPFDLIADLGSGNAKIPLAMCALLPASVRVCAVEMSPEMLAVAARNRTRDGVSSERLQLVTADVKQIPFADRSVGMITSNSLVHHIPDPHAVFLEMARIARPGAPILIRDLVRPETQSALETLLDVHATHWSTLQRTLYSDSLHAALTLEEVQTFLDECGLSDVKVTQVNDRHWSAERA